MLDSSLASARNHRNKTIKAEINRENTGLSFTSSSLTSPVDSGEYKDLLERATALVSSAVEMKSDSLY